jgi:hypothetical protein
MALFERDEMILGNLYNSGIIDKNGKLMLPENNE